MCGGRKPNLPSAHLARSGGDLLAKYFFGDEDRRNPLRDLRRADLAEARENSRHFALVGFGPLGGCVQLAAALNQSDSAFRRQRPILPLPENSK